MLGFIDCAHARHHEGWQHTLQISTGAERLVTAPDHHALVVFLSHVDSHAQAFSHAHADRVHLGFEAGNDDFIVQSPQADVVVLVQRFAGNSKVRMTHALRMAAHGLREMLTRIHG